MATNKLLESNNLRVLPCVPRFIHLDPIEDLWEIVVKTIYHVGRLFETIAALKNCIQEFLDGIDVDMVKKLSCFLLNRVAEVIAVKKQPKLLGLQQTALLTQVTVLLQVWTIIISQVILLVPG